MIVDCILNYSQHVRKRKNVILNQVSNRRVSLGGQKLLAFAILHNFNQSQLTWSNYYPNPHFLGQIIKMLYYKF